MLVCTLNPDFEILDRAHSSVFQNLTVYLLKKSTDSWPKWELFLKFTKPHFEVQGFVEF